MKIFRISKITKEIVGEYANIISWSEDYVEFKNNGNRCKIYCNENEYFTNENIVDKIN